MLSIGDFDFEGKSTLLTSGDGDVLEFWDRDYLNGQWQFRRVLSRGRVCALFGFATTKKTALRDRL